MSRALGAAFLGHQVAQLENRINKTPPSPSPSPRGGAIRGGRGGGRGGGGRIWNPDRNGGQGVQRARKRSFSLHPEEAQLSAEGEVTALASPLPIVSVAKDRPIMANVIILDASVLVYALGQVKRWCKEERKETLIVPLEGESFPVSRCACTNYLTYPTPNSIQLCCVYCLPLFVHYLKSSTPSISSRRVLHLLLYTLEPPLVFSKHKLVSTPEFRSSVMTNSVLGTKFMPQLLQPTLQLSFPQRLPTAIPSLPKIMPPNG